jgi:hypothetical protein
MNARRQRVGLDIGSATVKLARGDSVEDVVPVSFPARGGHQGALAAVGHRHRQAGICLAVPDGWLDGGKPGTTAQEELRQLAEDVLGLGPVGWVGQHSAVAALSARNLGAGRYLIADLGAAGVRAAVVDADGAGGTVTIAAHQADGGCRDFDARLRALLAVDGRELAEDWYREASEPENDRRARLVLGQAVKKPDYGDVPAYIFTGQGGPTVFAAELISSFAPIRDGLAECLTAVSGGRSPDRTVLTGGLGWFPLAGLTMAETTGAASTIAPPHAAAHGALLFALGQARQAARAPLAITVPVHRIIGGRLEAADIPLDPASAFTDFPDGPPHLEGDDLMLNINGSPEMAPLPGLVPGPHRVGLRRGWAGSALVVRPTDGGPALIAALDGRDAR